MSLVAASRTRAGRVACATVVGALTLALSAPAAQARGVSAGGDGAAPTGGPAPVTTLSDPAPSDVAAAEKAARSQLLSAVSPAPVSGEVGGAVFPTRSKAFVTAEFAGAGEQRVELPAEASRPAVVAGAFVQVVVTAPATGRVEISVNGDRADRWTPAVVADATLGAGRIASATTLVQTGSQMWVRSTAAATVRIRVVAWVRDEPRADVPAGGVGIAVRPGTAFSTRGLSSTDEFTDEFAEKAGVGVYLTGEGGIPAQAAQMVFVQAEFDPVGDADRPLVQARDPRGRWYNVAMLSGEGVQRHLIAVLVDDVGFVRLRATDDVRATFTPVGWVSRGYPTLQVSQTRSVFPIVGDTLALGSASEEAADWEQGVIPGLPRGDVAVTAMVQGQAFGSGNVRIDGGDLGEWSEFAVDGIGSASLFVPDAQDGVAVRASRGVQVHVQAVAYLLMAAPEGRAAVRSRGERPRVSIDQPRQAAREQRRTGQFSLTGTARGVSGIAQVRVSVPGVDQQPFASVEHATGRWSIDLRLPAGATAVTVIATDLEGRTARSRVNVMIAGDEGATPQVATDLFTITGPAQRRIKRIGPNFIDFSGRTPPAAVPGGVLSAAPFAKAPDGLLRKVATLRQVGPTTWRVYTAKAGLADVLVNGTVGTPDRAPRIVRGNPLVARWDLTFPVDLSSDDIFDTRDEDGTGIAFQGALQARLAVVGSSSFALGLRIQTKWLIVPVGVELYYFEYTYDNRIRLISDRVLIGVSDGAVMAVDKPLSKSFRFTLPITTGVAITGGFTPEYQLLLNGSLELTGEASIRTNLRFVYDKDLGGWQEVRDDWFTEPTINANVTFNGNAKVGIGGRVDVGINDVAGVELEFMIGVIGVKGQAALRVRSGLADQPDEFGVNCDAENSNLEVFSTFDMQLKAFFEKASWPIVRLDPWRQVWYAC